jgi:pyrimidine and pyridine-specific 5'-nucleotidase
MEMYEKAMMEAGVTDKARCYFVDDSLGNSVAVATLISGNCRGAKQFGWTRVCHLLFPEDQIPPAEEGIKQIHDILDLKTIYPHLFRKRI